MALQLTDQVVDKRRRCIDLRDQRGGLTAAVLESLRAFLRHNDLYIHLCVSDNLLGSEALAELCTLVKRHPYLTSLEAQHCGLQDKDFCFYFGPALISMPRLTFVDLSRNSGLADASADTVARILLETEVESIRLVGTSLTAAGGRVIAAAAANTTALVHCELPYTVGNVVLDAVEAHTRRNRAHRDRLQAASTQFARLQLSHCRLPSLPGLRRIEAAAAGSAHLQGPTASSLEPSPSSSFAAVAPAAGSGAAAKKSVAVSRQAALAQTSEERQWRACVAKGRRQTLLRAEPTAVATAAAAAAPASGTATAAADGSPLQQQRYTPTLSSTPTTALSTPATARTVKDMSPSPFSYASSPPSAMRRAKATPDSLEAVTMWDWADPAMSNALHCLFVLDHQAQVLDQYRAAAAVPESARRARTRSRGRGGSFSARRGSSGVRTAESASLPPLRSP